MEATAVYGIIDIIVVSKFIMKLSYENMCMLQFYASIFSTQVSRHAASRQHIVAFMTVRFNNSFEFERDGQSLKLYRQPIPAKPDVRRASTMFLLEVVEGK